MSAPRVYAIAAEFDSAKDLYHAAEKVRDAGYKHWDVFSPFPIHGMDEAMGLGRSWLSLPALIGGIVGCLAAFVLVYYTGYIDYPTMVQGKPFFAFEPTFPIFFELTILVTAFATCGSLLVFNLLPRFNHPMFNWDRFERVTDDKFFLAIEARDPLFMESEARELLESIGGAHISLVHDDPEDGV